MNAQQLEPLEKPDPMQRRFKSEIGAHVVRMLQKTPSNWLVVPDGPAFVKLVRIK